MRLAYTHLHVCLSSSSGWLSMPKTLVDNYPEPGKRPLSSTTPIIIEDESGSFYSALGGSGGSRIFPAVFQTILNLDWGMDISAAIEYGRMHDQLFPLVVDTDDILPPALLDGLRKLGHNISGEHVHMLPPARMVTDGGSVADTSRIAAVVQGVVKLNDTIYGQFMCWFMVMRVVVDSLAQPQVTPGRMASLPVINLLVASYNSGLFCCHPP